MQKIRQDLAAAQRQFELLDTEIKHKQSTGNPVGEAEFQRLYQLDVQRRQLAASLAEAESRPTSPAGAAEPRAKRLISEQVTEEEIAEVVSAWTGIPVTRMMETERAKLLVMEERLHQRVVGQEAAVTAVSNAVRRSRSGLQDPNRPIGSFLFLGPTGVGKTELCKALAEVLFDDESALVRIDMSEFMERHSVSRLIGAPPGYVGYEEGGKLTEAVRRRPYCVVLLDEIEKAHDDVYNILLQVLDDGRLTDNHGHTVDFTNTIIVMTSNVGSPLIQQIAERGGNAGEMREAVDQAVQARFLPELLNRIDEKIVFEPLRRPQIRRIVDLQIRRLEKRLREHQIALGVTDDAREALAEQGYDVRYGARPLKRLIQQAIENPLATELLKGELSQAEGIEVDFRRGEFAFERSGEPATEATAAP